MESANTQVFNETFDYINPDLSEEISMIYDCNLTLEAADMHTGLEVFSNSTNYDELSKFCCLSLKTIKYY